MRLPSLRRLSLFVLLLLAIEFLDEFVFGAWEAAWPLIRDDLALDYFQIGLLQAVPSVVSSLVEPALGVLADLWKRRLLILGGGLFFALALLLTALSRSFWPLLLSFVLFYPASGAFVSVSQVALMDHAPERREQNMARWTFAGSLGVVAGPLALGGVAVLGLGWRGLFFLFAGLALGLVALARPRLPVGRTAPEQPQGFWGGLRSALRALRRGEVLRWLILLEFSDLMLDVLLGFLALYLVDVAGLTPAQGGIGVAVWTGVGLVGDLLLIPLLERVRGLDYLRWSTLAELLLFPAFLLIPSLWAKWVLLGLLGLFNAGWYSILQAQLYAALPGQAGAAITLGNLVGLLGGLVPLALASVAQHWGLQEAMWLLLLGPLALLAGLPRRPSGRAG
ncbi:MAG: MFS transporter [Chloroflexia bacterium]|nr:MFS transporter [Chloroflexia bacterium]